MSRRRRGRRRRRPARPFSFRHVMRGQDWFQWILTGSFHRKRVCECSKWPGATGRGADSHLYSRGQRLAVRHISQYFQRLAASVGFKSGSGLFGNWIFEHTRPRNGPGKTKLGLPGTQNDGRSSRNSLESVLKPKTKLKIAKTSKIPKIQEFPHRAPIGHLWAHRGPLTPIQLRWGYVVPCPEEVVQEPF